MCKPIHSSDLFIPPFIKSRFDRLVREDEDNKLTVTVVTGPIFNTMYRILDRKELDVVEFKINEKVLSKSVVDYLSNLSAYQPQAYNLRVIKSGLNDEIQVEMQQVPAETSFTGLLDHGTSASIRFLHCGVSDKGILV